MGRFFQKYLMPGLVFQGVVIGGGYATGRELIEFFAPSGAVGGLLGMAVAALLWGLVMAVSFELCRMTRSYDYMTFFRALLGRFWWSFEILLFVLMVLILGVVSAAAGEIANHLTGVPPLLGTLALLVAVGILVFYGSAVIERFMSAWSILLYVTFGTLVVAALFTFGDDIAARYESASIGNAWFIDGIRYAGYNVACVPTVFFCLRHLETRREAMTAGLLAGPMGMIPAVCLYVAMMGYYPEITSAAVPSTVLLDRLGSDIFKVIFEIAVLGTLVQTGLGLIHSINERIAATFEARGRVMPKILRPVIAVTLLLSAFGLAYGVGLINLIAKGYGTLTWGFILVFVLPVLTLGLWKLGLFRKIQAA